MRFIKNLGREVSVCPCCGAELHEGVISSKEDKLLEIAKNMGVTNLTFGKEEPKGFIVGETKNEDDGEKLTGEVITKENVMEKLAPEINSSITVEPKAKPVTKKKAKK